MRVRVRPAKIVITTACLTLAWMDVLSLLSDWLGEHRWMTAGQYALWYWEWVAVAAMLLLLATAAALWDT